MIYYHLVHLRKPFVLDPLCWLPLILQLTVVRFNYYRNDSSSSPTLPSLTCRLVFLVPPSNKLTSPPLLTIRIVSVRSPPSSSPYWLLPFRMSHILSFFLNLLTKGINLFRSLLVLPLILPLKLRWFFQPNGYPAHL